MFLTLMVIGLAGLAVMALPALGGHAHAAHLAKLGPGRGSLLTAAATTSAATTSALTTTAPTRGRLARVVPSPRAVFSWVALYGAFGNVLVAAHLSFAWAAFAAMIPTVLVERFAVTPLWRLLFRFEGQPSAPLASVVMSEATAVTVFRKGRGIVSVVRDGRLVQFSARMIDAQVGMPVRVGDRLRVEDVDSERERLTVSMLMAG